MLKAIFKTIRGHCKTRPFSRTTCDRRGPSSITKTHWSSESISVL